MNSSMLVNATNLHTGGGVAVATSLLSELSQLPGCEDITAAVSREVHANLMALPFPMQKSPMDRFHDYRVTDTNGLSSLRPRCLPVMSQFDSVFTVFGPLYRPTSHKFNVVGFAQPWVAYPHNEALGSLSLRQRWLARIRYDAVSRAFASATCLVVEQDHVRNALLSIPRFRSMRIEVVPNVVDSLHFAPERWSAIQLPPRRADLRLGVVARNYPHKNLEVIPEVLEALRERYRLSAEFFVTFSPDEFSHASPRFQRAVSNAGVLRIDQVPSFNRQLDAVVFPSLLECFSATPIEALAARTPLFASDRGFVRETVGEHASYFDPRDPIEIAATIARFFHLPIEARRERAEHGFRYVYGAPYTSLDRAKSILQILRGLR